MKQIFHTLVLILVIISFSCSSSTESIKIIPREEWKAAPAKPFQSHIPEKITIHHEGTVFDPAKKNAAEHIKNVQTWGMGKDRNWADMPYHFMIDFDGNIYEGRNVFTTGETATTYNPEGHLLITCLGNFEVQEVTEKQLESLINLIAYCCEKYNISPDTISGHKDFAETACPGKNLYSYIQSGYLVEQVKQKLGYK